MQIIANVLERERCGCIIIVGCAPMCKAKQERPSGNGSKGQFHSEGRVAMLVCKMSWVHVNAWIERKTIRFDSIMTFPKVTRTNISAKASTLDLRHQ